MTFKKGDTPVPSTAPNYMLGAVFLLKKISGIACWRSRRSLGIPPTGGLGMTKKKLKFLTMFEMTKKVNTRNDKTY
jgi:hypothetical protein